MPQPRYIVRPGTRHHRLTILEEVEPRITPGSLARRVKVRCDCGSVKVVALHNMLRQKTKSCGCWRSDRWRDILDEMWAEYRKRKAA